MRAPLEVVTVGTGLPCPASSVSTFNQILPVSGEGWDTMRLTFTHVIAGSGGTAFVLGGFTVIKNIELKTSKGELICSCPGMGLYQLNYMNARTEPYYTAVAAGAGTFYSVIDIPFNFWNWLQRGEDLYLDSGAYQGLELQVTTGAIADYYTTVGSQTLTSIAVDITLLRTAAAKDKTPATGKQSQPKMVPYIRKYATVNPSSQPWIILESAQDLSLIGLIGYGMTGNASLVPYYNAGTAANCVKNVTFRDNNWRWLNNVTPIHFNQEARRIVGAERVGVSAAFSPVGYYPHFFVRNLSLWEAFWSGNKSEIRLEWTFDTGSNPSFDLLAIGYRRKRAV